MPEKLSLNLTLKKLGDDWESDNLLDEVEKGNLPIFVRYCWFEHQYGGFGLRNERIWSNNTSDNEQNIRTIREAVNINSPSFKLILSDNQKAGQREKGIDFEDYRQYPKDGSIVLNGKTINFFDHLGQPTLVKIGKAKPVILIKLLKQDYIKTHENSLPSRFEKRGPFTVLKPENIVYSNPISVNDIFFLENDIQVLIPDTSEEKSLKSKNVDPIQKQSKKLKPATFTRKNTWRDALLHQIKLYEEKYSKTPTQNQLWSFLIGNPSEEYGISYNKTKKALEIEGEKPLDKDNFIGRYNRIYPKTSSK